MKQVKKKDIREYLHILLSTFAIGFYLQMGLRNKGSNLYWLFLALVVFEAVLSFLYTYRVEPLMRFHVLLQKVTLVFPFAFLVLSTLTYYDHTFVRILLNMFHLDQLSEFIENHSIVWSILLFIMWNGRINLTRTFVIETNAKDHISDTQDPIQHMKKKDFNGIRIFFNFTFVIFFSIMAYFNQSGIDQLYISLAIFELCMNQPWSIFIMRLHNSYQAMLLSAPLFLFIIGYFHLFCPIAALEFLSSYGLDEVSKFVTNESLIVSVILLWFSLVRLINLDNLLVMYDTKTQIKEIKKKMRPLVSY